MNKIFYLFLCLFPVMATHAQIHEVGVFLGGSNYIGDIGPTTYISPNEPAIGVLYKWNKSPRHSYRFSYTQSKITSNDLDSKEVSRYQREYRFENNLKEVSLGLEFNFFDFNLHESSRKISPYVASGLSYFLAKYTLTDLKTDTSVRGRTERRKSIALPITIGVKSNISPRLVLALETGARYTLTDNIDGSFNQNFGNINNNDWYVFTGATLTYTFGNKPCYCAE
ncbi:DUF6089 family protein [Flavobacterium sp. GSP14]|uniref:type IX secretion system protein PorG n=1 Tax=Flavobacterium sp. GSP14 TaxID=3401734 RepID=UPI003AAE4325